MLRLTKELLQHIEALKVQIAENKKVLDNPQTKLTVYFRANQKEKELKQQLHEAERALTEYPL